VIFDDLFFSSAGTTVAKDTRDPLEVEKREMTHGHNQTNARVSAMQSVGSPGSARASDSDRSQLSPSQQRTPMDLEDFLETLASAFAERVAAQLADLIVERQAPPAPVPGGWIDKVTASKALGISVATMDRLVRAGAPVHVVGARRRFDLADLRQWLATRGSAPTTPIGVSQPATPAEPADDDIFDMARQAGIRPR